MPDRSPTGDSAESWVVDVTAPLPPARVRLVAAEAAARLNLPAEKLVALLDNRIGPVTKPLPRASADRVAEVLDLAGAEVEIRPATEADGPHGRARASTGGRRAQDHEHDASRGSVEAAPEEDRGSGAAREAGGPEEAWAGTSQGRPADRGARHDAAASGAEESTRHDQASHDPTPQDPPPLDPDPPEREARGSTPPAGRGARARSAPEPSAPGGVRSTRDPFEAMRHEPEDDAAMLGSWGAEDEGSSASWQARPVEPASAGSAGSHVSASYQAPPPPRERVPPQGAYDVPDDDAEEEDVFAYGIRDPLADADEFDRRNRRVMLVTALVVATLVFLVLQWAMSDANAGTSPPAPYTEGLQAYRAGAFVGAARAWHPRAEAGDARAMFMLGYMAEFGQGRAWSNHEAAEWYRQAAQRGHPLAQARLAGLYERGLGVPRDPERALSWYRAAGDAGVPEAELAAARLLAGSGWFAEARDRLERAARVLPEAAGWQDLMRAGGR